MTTDAPESTFNPATFWEDTAPNEPVPPADQQIPGRRHDGPVRPSEHRDDIQGLRALAVLLVVLGHAGIGFLKGGYVGVDVFFVLSGFLITGVLLGGAAKRGFVSFSDFYVRRARRILPAAALTLVVTDVVAYRLLNFVRAKQIVLDSIWASSFAANVRFSRLGVDYFAQGQPPSAVQHFWSLAVEEQFYLIWPAVVSVVLFGILLRRRARSRRHGLEASAEPPSGRLLVVIVAATAASLAWSIHVTRVAPTSAYFSTLARAWELGLGAALAIGALGLSRIPAGVRALMGWLGMAAILAAAVSYSSGTPFPGYAALLPTVGAALVIGAGIGARQSRRGVGRVLSIGPARYVGDRSYAFYLWHWPVLVIAVQYVGHDLSVARNLLLLAGAFLLSVVSYRLVEDPIRRSTWSGRSSALLWPVSVGAVLLVAGWSLQSIDVKASLLETAAPGPLPTLAGPSPEATGSSGLALSPPVAGTSKALPAVVAAVRAAQGGASLPSGLTPSVSKLTDDWSRYDCQAKPGETSSPICRVGATSSRRSMVVIGDSHMQMWMPAIVKMASQDGWAVIPLIKPGCVPDRWVGDHPEVLAIGSLHVNGKPECMVWFQWTVRQVESLHPKVTVVGGSLSAALRAPGTLADSVKGFRVAATSMRPSSPSVVVIGDPLALTVDPVNCLLAPHASMATCTSVAPIQEKLLYGDVGAAAQKGRRCVPGHDRLVLLRGSVPPGGRAHDQPPRWSARHEDLRRGAFRCVPDRVPCSRSLARAPRFFDGLSGPP